jgi:hypothetical protein
MPVWMWLNIPLMVLVFGAVVGIPYWLAQAISEEGMTTVNSQRHHYSGR